jgi:hypothetical protein
MRASATASRLPECAGPSWRRSPDRSVPHHIRDGQATRSAGPASRMPIRSHPSTHLRRCVWALRNVHAGPAGKPGDEGRRSSWRMSRRKSPPTAVSASGYGLPPLVPCHIGSELMRPSVGSGSSSSYGKSPATPRPGKQRVGRGPSGTCWKHTKPPGSSFETWDTNISAAPPTRDPDSHLHVVNSLCACVDLLY